MAKIKVARLEQYPPDDPNSWAVGFVVTCKNGRQFYIDTSVPFSKASSDEDAVKAALKELKDSIKSQVKSLESKSSLLNQDVTSIFEQLQDVE